jgi:hypothetical protein
VLAGLLQVPLLVQEDVSRVSYAVRDISYADQTPFRTDFVRRSCTHFPTESNYVAPIAALLGS